MDLEFLFEAFERINNKFSGDKKKNNTSENDELISGDCDAPENISKETHNLFKIRINMESQFYNINILQLLLKWKYHIGIIVIIAMVLSAIFSSPVFITPKFKSFAVVYPSNIAPYSDENETEQMLQILQSRDITDNIVEMYNLSEHYKIAKDYKYYYTTMLWEYSQNVSVSKTPNEAVSIEVMDKDPQIACDMVNSMIDLYNEKVRDMHEEKFGEVVNMYNRALIAKRNYIDSLELKLKELGVNYGLTDYGHQSEQVTKGFLKTIDGTGASRVNDKEVKKLKENIEEKGGELIVLHNLISRESIKYVDMKHEYDIAKMDYDRKFTYTNVINRPYVADKKAYPVRWLMVVVTALAAFFVTFIAILILENFKGMSAKTAKS